jgi:hypothetical protein
MTCPHGQTTPCRYCLAEAYERVIDEHPKLQTCPHGRTLGSNSKPVGCGECEPDVICRNCGSEKMLVGTVQCIVCSECELEAEFRPCDQFSHTLEHAKRLLAEHYLEQMTQNRDGWKSAAISGAGVWPVSRFDWENADD